MKKKLLSVALCSLLTLGLASCDLFKPNSSSSEPSSSEVSSSEKSEVSSEEKSEVSSSEKEESSEPVSSEPESSEPVSSEPESSEPESSEPESSLPESSEPESSDPIVPETVTLYFENNWLWTDVCAYVYNSTLEENNYEVEWPGTKLEVVDTLTDNNSPRDRYVVTIDVSQGYDTVIFNGVKNDGSGDRDQSPAIVISELPAGNDCIYMDWDSVENKNSYGSYTYSPIEEQPGDDPITSEPSSSEPESSEPESSLPESSEPESSEPNPEEPNVLTIYFQNNWMWSEVSAYVFDADITDGENWEIAWPGSALVKVGVDNTYDMYVVEIDLAQGYDTVIFNGVKNDGSGNRDQSPNIDLSTVEEGTAFYMTWNDGNDVGNFPYTPEVGGGDVEIPDTPNPDVPSSSETTSSEPVSSEPESSEPESSLPESSEPESSEPVVPETYTFYYYNNLNWASVSVHYWVDGGAGTTWPGVPATAVEGEDNWYSITFTAEEIQNLKFIFNNSGNGQQTGNITVDSTNPYHYGKSSLSYESKDAVYAAIENPVTFTWYLRGDVNGWAESELYGLVLNGDSTTEYVIENVQLSAGSKFKISDGSTWLGYSNVKGGDDECKALLNAPDSDGNIVIKEAGSYTIYFESGTSNYGLWIAKN